MGFLKYVGKSEEKLECRKTNTWSCRNDGKRQEMQDPGERINVLADLERQCVT